MLAKKADRVLVCFEQAREILGGGDKIVLTGAPVRGEILAADRAAARARFGLGEADQLVVSFWGSMGAKYMNEHMAAAVFCWKRMLHRRHCMMPSARCCPTGKHCGVWDEQQLHWLRRMPVKRSIGRYFLRLNSIKTNGKGALA